MSGELIPAVEMALEQVGDQLEEEELSQIEAATENVTAILQRGDKDAAALKKANLALDEATQTLAAILVEAAFADPDS